MKRNYLKPEIAQILLATPLPLATSVPVKEGDDYKIQSTDEILVKRDHQGAGRQDWDDWQDWGEE